MAEKKPLIYICGPINKPEYYKAFEAMEDELTALGYNPLSPARLPEMDSWDRHRITTAMIDSADAVVMLPKWQGCETAASEHYMAYCLDRPIVEMHAPVQAGWFPLEVVHDWLKHDLAEALGEVSA